MTRSAATRRMLLTSGSWLLASHLAAACGQVWGGPTGPPRVRSGITLTFMSTSGGADAETKARYAAQFRERYPGLTLEHLPITTGGNVALYEKLQATLAAGTSPDLAYMHPEFLLSYTARTLLRSLNPFARRDRYDLSDFYRTASEQYRVAGELYAVARGFAMEVLIYNLDLFERAGMPPPPTDWKERSWDLDTFLAAARRLTAAEGSQTGYAAAHLASGGGAVTVFHRTWVFVYAMGGAVLDADGRRLRLAEPRSVDGLQYLADLSHRHRVAPVPAAASLFGQGRAAMDLTGAYAFNGLRQVAGLRWGAAVVPRGPGGRFSSGSGVGWAMPAAGKNPEEAWLGLQYIASREVQELEAALGNVMPARRSVAFGPAFLDPSKPPKEVRVFADAGDFTHETPRAAAWPEIAEILAAEFQPLWRGERTARAMIETLRPRVEALLKG